ncbi:MAG: hypothetical protein ACRDHG_10735 [Anaerolineales bacterium]
MRLLSLALGCLCAAALLALARNGPDFAQYLDWGQAFASGDIFEIQGSVLSPGNVPLTQWAHGTGLVLSLPQVLTGQRFSSSVSAIFAGWVAGLVFWWAMHRLLSRAAGGSVPLTLFGIGAAFLGTHAGFYSHTHGSESIGYALGAVLALSLLPSARWRLSDALAGGAAATLLIGVRPNLAIYVLPATILLGARAIAARRIVDKRTAAIGLGWVILTTTVAILQTVWVNYRMTGELLGSPYLFAGNGFRSIDLANPQFLAVLAHPWHGLVAYHPLYAVGAAALVTLAFSPRPLRERVAWIGLGLLILIQLYVQASWYVWWLGIWTFGQRGMSITAIILVPALVKVIRDLPFASGKRRNLWILLTLGACLWSYLLMLQGETSFHTYAQLTDAQAGLLDWLTSPGTLATHVGGIALTGVIVRRLIQRNQVERAGRLTLWAAGLLLILSLTYLGFRVAVGSSERVVLFGLVALALTAGSFSVLAISQRGANERVDLHHELPGAAGIAAGMVGLFMVTTGLFARLALQTQVRIAADTPPTRVMLCSSRVRWDKVRESYEEYLQVPGFAIQKAGLRAFLNRTGGLECPELALPSSGSLPISGTRQIGGRN